ncbi:MULTISPECIES: D-hexose-6-phosphate mutarotase [unclassified Vibrio]|uniref:Putative glucose-6-phosphate 1-epimerase n=1 Tax=Vibrio sp. HB236076 TaxID=3232307 RepID=A0AB39HIE7_9VIBR|nr:D-hexose-6-phosphate mutarotase [Vibrio sp. HB161653]MDP5254717.1 D-hexose-6-phosphate mutarotase [Vibrio sp. HB161653]
MNWYTLAATDEISSSISRVDYQSCSLLRIIHPKVKGVISLFGGHVISCQPKGKDDLLWLSEQAIFDAKTALRGGIPLCFPWFNKAGLPSHGFARISNWALDSYEETPQGVTVTLVLSNNEQTQQIWPFAFDAKLTVIFSDSLSVSLSVTNSDDKPWRYSGALHSYLKLGDIRQASVKGLGPLYLDSLDQRQEKRSLLPLIVNQEVDRVYTKAEPTITINDDSLNRQLSVHNGNNNSVVAWNPWQHGAQAMKDMADNGYEQFVCIESTVFADTIETGRLVEPGQTDTLSTIISAR